MSTNDLCDLPITNAYNCGVIIVPACSTATLGFSSDADYENIILISRCFPDSVIHVANNKTKNGLDNFTIKNSTCCPKYYIVSSFHRVSINSEYIQNSINTFISDDNNFAYGFEDSTDGDYNDIVVYISLGAIN